MPLDWVSFIHTGLREDDQDGYVYLPELDQSLEDTEDHTLLDDRDNSLQNTGSYIWIGITDVAETRKEVAPAATQASTGKYLMVIIRCQSSSYLCELAFTKAVVLCVELMYRHLIMWFHCMCYSRYLFSK